MSEKNLKNDNELSRDVFLAALIFLLGSKVTVIAELVHKVYLSLLKPLGDHNPIYTIEFTLLALAVGTGGLVISRLLFSKNNQKNNNVIITGTTIGLLAALLQVTELTFLENIFPLQNFIRTIFFIIILLFLVIFPLKNNHGAKLTHEYALATLSRLVIGLMIGFFSGLFASLIITIGFRLYIPTATHNSFSTIANSFEFNPVAYITLSTAWVIMAFADTKLEYPIKLIEFLPNKRFLYKALNWNACVLTAFLYGAFITQMGKDPKVNFELVTGIRYAFLTAITMSVFCVIKAPVKIFKIYEMIIIFLIIGLGYFLSFGHINSSTNIGISQSIIYGLIGVFIYYLLGFTHRITILVLGNRPSFKKL